MFLISLFWTTINSTQETTSIIYTFMHTSTGTSEYILGVPEVLSYFGAERLLLAERQSVPSLDDDAWHHDTSTY